MINILQFREYISVALTLQVHDAVKSVFAKFVKQKMTNAVTHKCNRASVLCFGII